MGLIRPQPEPPTRPGETDTGETDTDECPSGEGQDDPDGRFRAVYESRYPAIYAYVVRRLGAGTGDVPDVTAEVFAVAWRRQHELPDPPADLPWLYGVARRIVSRHGRTLRRRTRLHERLAGELRVPPGDARRPDPDTLAVRAAIGRLRPSDREVLRLVLWEELSHADAAVVLGCSANAVALRLHKARRRLRQELGVAPDLPSGRAASRTGRHAQQERGADDGPR